ncbi:MAG: methyltransferase domain-containing protein, partial [Myxococcales bacterium]|nr:methyltransferase domain-containing protein [Myxococcales bacterium]
MSRWEDPRRVLERHGRAPKKSFSQNFLVSRTHAERIAAFAARAKLPVLELGPGVGTLTALLLDAGARVHAVERDRDMLDVLAQEFQNEPSLSVVEGDAVTFDIGAWAKEMGGKVVVTGNLPYAVT